MLRSRLVNDGNEKLGVISEIDMILRVMNIGSRGKGAGK